MARREGKWIPRIILGGTVLIGICLGIWWGGPEDPEPAVSPIVAEPTGEVREETPGAESERVPEDPLTRWRGRSLPARWRPDRMLPLARLAHRSDAGEFVTREELRSTLAESGGEAVASLAHVLALEPRADVRREILLRLLELAPSNPEALEACVRHVDDWLENPLSALAEGIEEQLRVIEALGEIESPVAFEALLRWERSPSLETSARIVAIRSLARQPSGTRLAGHFEQLFRQHSSVAVRRAAARALVQVKRVPELAELRQLLESETREELQEVYLELAARLPSGPELFEWLRRLALDPARSGIRLAVARTVSAHPGRSATAILEEMLEREEDPAVRKHLERWLRAR